MRTLPVKCLNYDNHYAARARCEVSPARQGVLMKTRKVNPKMARCSRQLWAH